MDDLSNAKRVVRDFTTRFDLETADARIDICAQHCAADYRWRGVHPFHEQPDAAGAIRAFWSPFLTSFSNVQRREDVFFAGLNDCDDQSSVWTCSMGHLMALFDHSWLGIPATRKIAMLPYAEFHRIENGKIAETAFFCDILRVAGQAGLYPLPQQTAADMVNPGPRTNDGLLLGHHDPAEGAQTLALVNRMAADISRANRLLNGEIELTNFTPRDELAANWHEDMAWYGPTGIGATYTIDRYIEQHQQPFRKHLANRIFHGHVARVAEGNYCGFFGWPNLSVTPIGGYMGLPATGKPAPMRVVDVYRRDGDKLAENWVFIDLLHWLNVQGLDVLGRIAAMNSENLMQIRRA
ncbi:nuclear transport factor 2 family protein [Litoreibacter roseus]|uniref:Polyketide cyclase n=1 Tax=Litoreibacter roseus TaxID=2601869 RepID=A0A6N6JL88_9RHOB|nr:nuclear transport factor 2 family protein [Litoreibacter roseus]GFE66717.1 polyketide cyclase [Litoreibacter roseus]